MKMILIVTIPTTAEKVTSGPTSEYNVLTKTGPRLRAKLPAAVNTPIMVPCTGTMLMETVVLQLCYAQDQK